MTIEKIREAIKAQPFKPFFVNLADGRSFAVQHPEFIATTGQGRTIVVGDPHSDGIELIDLLLVTSLTFAGDGQAA
ncbi:MAG: hypothetical protein ACE37H_13040 [Phycisphaeraceae bacterium]